MGIVKPGLALSGFLLIALGVQAQPVRYHEAPLRQVLEEVAERTGYAVLYRDALVEGRTISLQTTSAKLIEALADALAEQGLKLEIDPNRRQLLVTEARRRIVTLSGEVRDARSGAPLPYATVAWHADAALQGTMADAEGRFRATLTVPERQDTLRLRVSYVGYVPQTVTVGIREKAIVVRLVPEEKALPAVVVIGSVSRLDGVDTSWQRLIRPERFAPFGEPGATRALQALPAVGLTIGLTNGLNVRGSQTDGFQLLLDGMPIYHPTHLFGLFDAFNADALEAVGFYYDVAPVVYAAPPGGTLAFATRAGSRDRLHATAGLSNVAGRLLLEGPLPGQQGSWLVAGRHALIGWLDWPGNAKLLAYGLDVARPTSPLPSQAVDLEARLLERGPVAGAFYDLHGSLLLDEARWRLRLSGYAGADEAQQQAYRLMPDWGLAGPLSGTPRWQPVATRQTWANRALSLQASYWLSSSLRLHTTLGMATYQSTYAKDDFLYTLSGGSLQKFFRRLAPFAYRNALYEGRWEQAVDLGQQAGIWTLGTTLQVVSLSYTETSALRLKPFVVKQHVLNIDGFGQYEGTPHPWVKLLSGVRLHTFATGAQLRLSPRVHLTLHPYGFWSVGVALSRNYQFLHRLAFRNTNSTGVWLLTESKQPPTAVDNLSLGMQLRPGKTRFSLDAYARYLKHLWQHEVEVPVYLVTRDRETAMPWLIDVEAQAHGLEVLLLQPLGPLEATLGYSLARIQMRHPAILNGAWYPAPWDRRHQLRAYLDVPLWPGGALALAWFAASGAPNTESFTDPVQPKRLGPYYRLDLTLFSRHAAGPATLEVRLGVFNLFDRANPWYREPMLVLTGPRLPRRFDFVPVDVYDLGRQASIDLTFRF